METLRTQVKRDIATELANYRAVAVATVDSYNPLTHTARVTLQPEGDTTGDLHVCVPYRGLHAPLQPGDSCLVGWDKGQPVAVVGIWYDDNNPPPSGAPFVFGDAVSVLGPLALFGTLTPAVLSKLPAAGSAYAHAVAALAPQTGVDGGLWYCQPTAAGSYVWRQLTPARGTATVTAATSQVVTHGLGVVPTSVQVTPQANAGGAWWVSGLTSSQFTINLAVSGTVPFLWAAWA